MITARSLAGLILLLSTGVTSAIVEERDARRHLQSDVPHANHIFNTIQSSMRQWGSSWNHNGMSFFLATVPADTELYFGLHKSSGPVQGTNWLAFEPEHSLFFAGTSFGPDLGPHPPCHPGRPPRHQDTRKQDTRAVHDAQRPLKSPENDRHGPPFPFPFPDLPGDWTPGYLHTYRTKHALSLLYIDGLSAAKTNIGTLDSQDYLLLNWTSDSQPHGPEQEEDRARELCNMAKYKWNSKIDGIVRMELGFEIILCDFGKHVDLVNIVRPPTSKDVSLRKYMSDNQFSWYRGIAARFDGIGYDRVTLHYNDFVTVFDSKLNIFPSGTASLPRLSHLNISDLATLRDRVTDLILRTPIPSTSATAPIDWQSVTDMITTRYASALIHFATLTNLTTLQYEIAMLMRPFIDFTNRNTTIEVTRCTNHFLPPNIPIQVQSSTAYRAVFSVSQHICTILLSTLSLSSGTPRDIYQTAFKNLTTYLDWTIWRRCKTLCSYDEVCFIPIWPFGTVQDRESGMGRCVNETEFWRGQRHGRNYWGTPGGPRRPPGDGPGPMPIPGGGNSSLEHERDLEPELSRWA